MSNSRRTHLANGEDLEIANPEDFEVERNDDGEILPVVQRVPGTDTAIKVRPMPPGAFNEYQAVLAGQNEDSARQAEVMREWITEPEAFASATEDYVENDLRGGVVGGILKAIRNAAGYEVFRAAREEEMADAGAMIEHLGEDTAVELMQDFADSDGISAER